MYLTDVRALRRKDAFRGEKLMEVIVRNPCELLCVIHGYSVGKSYLCYAASLHSLDFKKLMKLKPHIRSGNHIHTPQVVCALWTLKLSELKPQ